MPDRVRVKICGLTSVEDTLAAVRAGADAIGLNFVASSPRGITGQQALRIRESIPPFVTVVGVFANAPMNEVRSIAERVRLHAVQLHGQESPDPGWRGPFDVMKAMRVRNADDLAGLSAWNDVASAVLLDGAGGGKIFDWSLVTAARGVTSLPVVLAGGLNPGNVAEAIRMTGVSAVDVASGVESAPGKKDEALMHAFIANARGLS